MELFASMEEVKKLWKRSSIGDQRRRTTNSIIFPLECSLLIFFP